MNEGRKEKKQTNKETNKQTKEITKNKQLLTQFCFLGKITHLYCIFAPAIPPTVGSSRRPIGLLGIFSLSFAAFSASCWAFSLGSSLFDPLM